MSCDGEPITSEQQPSEQEVLDQATREREVLSVDLLSQYPAITDKVTELAVKFPDFRPNLNDHDVRKEAASLLIAMQEDGRIFEPEYDVTQKDSSALLEQIKRRIANHEKEENVDSKLSDTLIFLQIATELESEHGGANEAYFKAFQHLLNDPEALAAKFQATADTRDEIDFDGTFSTRLSDRIKLVNDNIAALQAMAGASPEYASQVEQAGIDVTDRQAVQSFVLGSGILTDETVDEVTREQIATNLDLPNHIATITGSDVDNALDSQNPDGSPRFSQKNPLPVRDGMAAYVRPDGTRIARVEVEGIGTREIPWQRGEKGEVIGLKLSLLKIWAINEFKGNTDLFGETVHINAFLSQTDPEKLRQTQQVMEALLGGEAGYDGVIITDNQAEFIGWFSQYVATKGDASEGDYDRHTAIENRTNLGLHPNGDATQIDYDVLRAAGSYAQGQYGSGAPDYFALQEHLHGLFPDRVPMTGANAVGAVYGVS